MPSFFLMSAAKLAALAAVVAHVSQYTIRTSMREVYAFMTGLT
jgi:hypothetical protein